MNTKRIHVVHIIPTLSFGGAERCVVDIINSSNPDKFRFSVIVFSNRTELAEQIIIPGVSVQVVKKTGQFSLWYFKRLREALKKLSPDVVHTHLFGGDVWGRVAARGLGIPIVTTEHNVNVDEGFIRDSIKRALVNFTARYVAASEAIAADMVKRYGVSRSRLAIIRYGINLGRFKNLPRPAFNPPWRLLLLGRLTAQKGQSIALQALARLKDRSWQLSIVGAGNLDSELRRLANYLGIAERVTFQPPFSDVPGLLVRHDCLLMPSRWEGLGIVIMEAMAAGRLVVAAKVGGIPELIKPGVTGYLVPPNDPASLAKQLERCFIHPDEARQLSAAGERYATEQFSFERMAKQYETVYEEVSKK